jgi:Bacteriophage minor capsid protein
MVSLIDIVRLIKSIVPNGVVYPLEFPVESPDTSISVDATASDPRGKNLYYITVQIKVRDTHPANAESTSLLIRSELEKMTNFTLGNAQVVFIEATTPFPIFIGKDGNGNYLYSTTFRFLINEGV